MLGRNKIKRSNASNLITNSNESGRDVRSVCHVSQSQSQQGKEPCKLTHDNNKNDMSRVSKLLIYLADYCCFIALYRFVDLQI